MNVIIKETVVDYTPADQFLLVHYCDQECDRLKYDVMMKKMDDKEVGETERPYNQPENREVVNLEESSKVWHSAGRFEQLLFYATTCDLEGVIETMQNTLTWILGLGGLLCMLMLFFPCAAGVEEEIFDVAVNNACLLDYSSGKNLNAHDQEEDDTADEDNSTVLLIKQVVYSFSCMCWVRKISSFFPSYFPAAQTVRCTACVGVDACNLHQEPKGRQQVKQVKADLQSREDLKHPCGVDTGKMFLPNLAQVPTNLYYHWYTLYRLPILLKCTKATKIFWYKLV